MIPIIRVNLRRAIGDRRLLFVATLFPVLFILVTGLLAGNPEEPIGLVHPSARLVHLVAHTGDLKVRIEPTGRNWATTSCTGTSSPGSLRCRPDPGHGVSNS